jgi:hypothetical protein
VLVKAAAKPEPVQVEEAEAEEAPKPIRGFGAAKAKPVAQESAKPKAAAKVAPVKAESVSDIADEIAGLLGEMDADDA